MMDLNKNLSVLLILVFIIDVVVAQGNLNVKEDNKSMKKMDHDYLWLPDGNLVKFFNSSKEELDNLRKSGQASWDAELSRKYDLEIYSTSKGYVIYAVADKFFYKFLLSDFIKASPVITASEKYTELRGRNPYGKDFPTYSKKLIADLGKELGIEVDELSSEVLRAVDNKLKEVDEDSKYIFRHRYYLHMIALVGETIILEYAGKAKWKIDLASDKVTWVPLVVIEGNSVPFDHYLFEDMFEHYDKQHYPLLESYETIIDIAKHNLKIEK